MQIGTVLLVTAAVVFSQKPGFVINGNEAQLTLDLEPIIAKINQSQQVDRAVLERFLAKASSSLPVAFEETSQVCFLVPFSSSCKSTDSRESICFTRTNLARDLSLLMASLPSNQDSSNKSIIRLSKRGNRANLFKSAIYKSLVGASGATTRLLLHLLSLLEPQTDAFCEWWLHRDRTRLAQALVAVPAVLVALLSSIVKVMVLASYLFYFLIFNVCNCVPKEEMINPEELKDLLGFNPLESD